VWVCAQVQRTLARCNIIIIVIAIIIVIVIVGRLSSSLCAVLFCACFLQQSAVACVQKSRRSAQFFRPRAARQRCPNLRVAYNIIIVLIDRNTASAYTLLYVAACLRLYAVKHTAVFRICNPFWRPRRAALQRLDERDNTSVSIRRFWTALDDGDIIVHIVSDREKSEIENNNIISILRYTHYFTCHIVFLQTTWKDNEQSRRSPSFQRSRIRPTWTLWWNGWSPTSYSYWSWYRSYSECSWVSACLYKRWPARCNNIRVVVPILGT